MPPATLLYPPFTPPYFLSKAPHPFLDLWPIIPFRTPLSLPFSFEVLSAVLRSPPCCVCVRSPLMFVWPAKITILFINQMKELLTESHNNRNCKGMGPYEPKMHTHVGSALYLRYLNEIFFKIIKVTLGSRSSKIVCFWRPCHRLTKQVSFL